MKRFLQDAGANPALRFQVRLTGLFRLLDRNWAYEQAPYANTQGLSIQLSPRRAGVGQGGGLMFCDALKLHPDGLAWFAWVNNRQDLDKLHALAAARRVDDGRRALSEQTQTVRAALLALRALRGMGRLPACRPARWDR